MPSSAARASASSSAKPLVRTTGRSARTSRSRRANSVPVRFGIVRSVTAASNPLGSASNAARANSGSVNDATR